MKSEPLTLVQRAEQHLVHCHRASSRRKVDERTYALAVDSVAIVRELLSEIAALRKKNVRLDGELVAINKAQSDRAARYLVLAQRIKEVVREEFPDLPVDVSEYYDEDDEPIKPARAKSRRKA